MLLEIIVVRSYAISLTNNNGEEETRAIYAHANKPKIKSKENPMNPPLF